MHIMFMLGKHTTPVPVQKEFNRSLSFNNQIAECVDIMVHRDIVGL